MTYDDLVNAIDTKRAEIHALLNGDAVDEQEFIRQTAEANVMLVDLGHMYEKAARMLSPIRDRRAKGVMRWNASMTASGAERSNASGHESWPTTHCVYGAKPKAGSP